MKKLMIASAITAVAIALNADVTSANIVGYNNRNSEGQQTPIVGAMFLPVNGAATIDLSELSMVMESNVSGDNYLDPWSDYIRFMDAESAVLSKDEEYCYIGQEFLDLIDCSAKTDAIGWWKHDEEAMYDELIANDDFDLKVKDDIDLKAGDGFLGQFIRMVEEETHEVLVNYKDAFHAK